MKSKSKTCGIINWRPDPKSYLFRISSFELNGHFSKMMMSQYTTSLVLIWLKNSFFRLLSLNVVVNIKKLQQTVISCWQYAFNSDFKIRGFQGIFSMLLTVECWWDLTCSSACHDFKKWSMFLQSLCQYRWIYLVMFLWQTLKCELVLYWPGI